jgi:protein gp37
MTMPERKPSWWWDWSWNPVSGCIPVSEGCRDCWSLAWLKCHTWKKPTVYTGAIREAVDGSIRWTGNLTALRAGDKYWDLPHTHPGVVNPALGDGKPNLIFTVVEGDLFVTGRPKEDIDRVCGTLAASEHIGQLCTKYTSQIVDYFTSLDPDAVRRWQPKIWLGFSAETQKWFDRRWADVRALAEAGWFVYVALSPLLGPVILPPDFLALGKRTWVIVYGECNRWEPERCRPMDADWARTIRDQCRAAGIPFFIRGMHTGAYVPPDLHIREFPTWP